MIEITLYDCCGGWLASAEADDPESAALAARTLAEDHAGVAHEVTQAVFRVDGRFVGRVWRPELAGSGLTYMGRARDQKEV